jgi:hypothetical protein
MARPGAPGGRGTTGTDKVIRLPGWLCVSWYLARLMSCVSLPGVCLPCGAPGRRDFGVVGRGGIGDEAKAHRGRIGQGPGFCWSARTFTPGRAAARSGSGAGVWSGVLLRSGVIVWAGAGL